MSIKSRKGISAALTVIITIIVLITVAMAVIMLVTGGLGTLGTTTGKTSTQADCQICVRVACFGKATGTSVADVCSTGTGGRCEGITTVSQTC